MRRLLARAAICCITIQICSSQTKFHSNVFGGGSGGGFPDLFKNFGSILGGGTNGVPSTDRVQSFCDAKSQNDAAVVAADVSGSCSSEHINLVFVLDGSGSVQESNFNKMKNFIAKIVETLDIGQDKSRVALVQFSTQNRVEFDFNDHYDADDIIRAILGIRYMSQGTKTAAALETVRDRVLDRNRGWRSEKATVVITLTDGEGEGDIRRVSDDLRRMENVKTLAVGIEPAQPSGGLFSFLSKKAALNPDQLLQIAGDKERVFVVCDFKRLDLELSNAITQSICNEVDQSCKDARADIVLLIDSSGSIGAQNFANLKGFLGSLAKNQDIGRGKSRIGLVQFSSETETEFSLSDDPAQVQRGISEMRWRRGRTNIGRAMEFVEREELSFRQRRDGVDAILIVLTDGNSDDDVARASTRLAAQGVTIFGVGVGTGVNDDTLEDIAGDSKRVFRVKDFDALDIRSKNAINDLVCKEKPSAKKSTSGEVGVGTKEEEFEYVGCFRRQARSTVFGRGLDRDNRDNAPSSCIRRCQDAGYSSELVGLEGKGLCHCADRGELEELEEAANPRSCGLTCQTLRDNPERHLCGGGTWISVYSTLRSNGRWTTRRPRTTTDFRIDGGGGGLDGDDNGDDCEAVPLDLVFVVDGSSSVGSENFEKIKAFMKGITAQADISDDETKISVVQFNGQPKTEFLFDDNRDRLRTLQALERIDWAEGETHLERALDHVSRQVLGERGGARQDTEVVVVVITDGESLGDPERAARVLRDDGAELVALGIGSDWDKAQLEAIVGRGNQRRVHSVRDFDELINGQLNKRYSDSADGKCVSPLGPLAVGLNGSGGRRVRSGNNVRGRGSGSSRGGSSGRSRGGSRVGSRGGSSGGRTRVGSGLLGRFRGRSGSRGSGNAGGSTRVTARGRVGQKQRRRKTVRKQRSKCRDLDIVLGVDMAYARTSREWREASNLMKKMANRLQKGDTKFGIFNIDQSSNRITVLHEFEESQTPKNVESEISAANTRRGTSTWPRMRRQIGNRNARADRDVAVLLFASQRSPALSSTLTTDLGTLKRSGVRIVGIQTHSSGAPSGRMGDELAALTTDDDVLNRPSLPELFDALQCDE